MVVRKDELLDAEHLQLSFDAEHEVIDLFHVVLGHAGAGFVQDHEIEGGREPSFCGEPHGGAGDGFFAAGEEAGAVVNHAQSGFVQRGEDFKVLLAEADVHLHIPEQGVGEPEDVIEFPLHNEAGNLLVIELAGGQEQGVFDAALVAEFGVVLAGALHRLFGERLSVFSIVRPMTISTTVSNKLGITNTTKVFSLHYVISIV